MKKVISMILAVAMVLMLFGGSVYAGNGNGNGNGHDKDKNKEFKDMKGHWGRESVERMQMWGILNGYDDGTFQPDRTLTQGELAVIIARLLEARQSMDDDDFDDDDMLEDLFDDDFDDDDALSRVPSWARDAVSMGFMNHYFNMNRFHSQVQCDRLTACVAIAKALKLKPVTDFTNNPFKDFGLMNDEDYGYLLALYKEGYISGYPDGKFNPNNLLTRAQIAIIIEKLLNGYDGTGTVKDVNAPTWDSKSIVTAAAINGTGVRLEWTAAKDDVKVVGYKVIYEVNNVDKVKYVSARTADITGLEPDEEYEFTVEARDAAGNWSDDGPWVKVTTDDTVADYTKPRWSKDSYLTATAINTNSVDLKWSGASDNEKVVAYKVIYENNNKKMVKHVNDATSVRITDLIEDEDYEFIVEARDAAGNWSDDGPFIEVTTLKGTAADTVAPKWPDGADLTISSSKSGIITIIWPDATDNVGVDAYKVYQNDRLIKTMDGDDNSVIIKGLDSDTEYTFKVKAVDDAGNMSASLTKVYLTE